MVHAIRILKCKNGHSNFTISYDSNECGCHHDGKPCIFLVCKDCFDNNLREKNMIEPEMIYIALDKEGVNEVEKMLK